MCALVASAFLGASLSGCTQADNPAPVKAPPPAPPTAEETKVPKKTPDGKKYGADEKYQKAFGPRNRGGE
jgi:hypothetical protein